MLFSDPNVSSFIRENFVAAWQSVRPVPTVEIDFGNGTKIKRTVNGNIATYICDPTGRVIDVIPGLNTPEAYLQELQAALRLYRSSLANFDETVRRYHVAPPVRVLVMKKNPADIGKMIVERPVKKAVLSPEAEAEALAADTEFNRSERKPVIHKILAEKVVRPSEITLRIYKEALHCDLEDPYLGLVSKAFNGGAYENR